MARMNASEILDEKEILNKQTRTSPCVESSGDNCDIFYAPELQTSDLDKTHNQIEILSLNKDTDYIEVVSLNANDASTVVEENQMVRDENKDQVEEYYDDALNPEWKLKDKHVFILSEAGKPIYTL